MTQKEHALLLDYIGHNHDICHCGEKSKGVKYVETIFDFRTKRYFYIKIVCLYSGGFEISKTNQNRNKDIYKEAIKWLDGESDEFSCHDTD